MKSLSSTGVAISLVSAFLFLALLAELYYLLYWKKKKRSAQLIVAADAGPAKEFVYLSSATATAIIGRVQKNPTEDVELEEGMDVELMRLHSLSGPPRFLFTIKEETREDLERSGSSRGRINLRDFLAGAEDQTTPESSPAAAAAVAPPQESSDVVYFDETVQWSSSPLPQMKFLRDAEEKLWRKKNQVNPLPNSHH